VLGRDAGAEHWQRLSREAAIGIAAIMTVESAAVRISYARGITLVEMKRTATCLSR